MSLWSSYFSEIWGRETIEESWGFIQWHYEGEVCFVDELYVIPEERRNKRAFELADRVTQQALSRGSVRLACSVWPENKVSSVSMQTVLAYGFVMHSVDGRRIILTKELGG